MIEFGRQLVSAVTEQRHALSYISDIREENGLLRIELELDRPAFFRSKEIDSWMFDCVHMASNRCDQRDVDLPIYRGVDQGAAERAIESGIDVVPSDAHWFGGPLEKALEYGGDYPHVLIIDGGAVERTSRQVAGSAPQADHDSARVWAGSEGWKGRGGWFNYSRLPHTDNARGTDYEAAYAWFIPGNPLDALLGVISCKPSALLAK